MTDSTTKQRKRLRAHFSFTKTPFHKAMRAAQMYDSQSQRELVAGLDMWTEVGGIALCTGPAGVGKSISLRRFLQGLDARRFHLVQFTYLPGSTNGFLRSMCRALGLQMHRCGASLYFRQLGTWVRSCACRSDCGEPAPNHGSEPGVGNRLLPPTVRASRCRGVPRP